MKLWGWVLGAVLASAPAALRAGPQATETFEEARAAAVEQLIDDIGVYAGWCTGQKLFAERDRVWTVVLSFEPDNEEAHKALGHKRAKDGTWGPDPRRLPPKNRNAQKLKEAPERWAKVVDPYRDRVLELMDEHAQELGSLGRLRELESLIAMSPDDEKLRAMNGEVRFEGEWLLKETVSGKTRRPELNAIVAQAAADAPPPQRIEPDELESSLGIHWTQTIGTSLVRVLGTGPEAEATTAVKVAHAAGALFQSVYGAAPEFPSPLRFFLLANAGEKEAFIEKHPGIDAATRKFFERIDGAGVPQSGDFCYWSDTPEKRVDGVARILLGWLGHKVYGITPEIGWLHEGFGIYLTRVLLGTRLNWFALPNEGTSTAEDQALRAKMYDNSVNWVSMAYEQLKGNRPPRLSRFYRKGIEELTANELLYSYALAAYLIEGRPDETAELLRRIGGGEDQVAAIQAVLGMDLEALDARVLTWLSQRK